MINKYKIKYYLLKLMSVFDNITDTTLDKLICTISNITPIKKTKSNQKSQQQVISEILFFAENIISNESQQEHNQQTNKSISWKQYNKSQKSEQNISNSSRSKVLKSKDNHKTQNLTKSRQSLNGSNLSNFSKDQKRIKQLYSSNKFNKLTKNFVENEKKQIQKTQRVENFKIAYNKKLYNNNQHFQFNSSQLKHKNSESSIKSSAFSKTQKLSDQNNQSLEASILTESRIDIPGQQIKRTQSRYLKKNNNAAQNVISKIVQDIIRDNSKEHLVNKSRETIAKKLNTSIQITNTTNIYARSKQLLTKKQNFIKNQQLSKEKKQMQSATFKPKLNAPKTQLQNFDKRLDQSKQKKIINKAKILKEQLNKNTFKPKINKLINNSNVLSKIKPLWNNQNHQITQIANSATAKSFFSEDNTKTSTFSEIQKYQSSAKRIAIHSNDDINYLLQ